MDLVRIQVLKIVLSLKDIQATEEIRTMMAIAIQAQLKQQHRVKTLHRTKIVAASIEPYLIKLITSAEMLVKTEMKDRTAR